MTLNNAAELGLTRVIWVYDPVHELVNIPRKLARALRSARPIAQISASVCRPIPWPQSWRFTKKPMTFLKINVFRGGNTSLRSTSSDLGFFTKDS